MMKYSKHIGLTLLTLWALLIGLLLGAAGMGHPKAQFFTGVAFHTVGAGNYASTWYEKAAEQGDPHAMYQLAWYSLTGDWGFPQDDEQAYKWFLFGMAEGIQMMWVDISVLSYHGVLFNKDSFIELGKSVSPEILNAELEEIRFKDTYDILPFAFDEEGYREALARIE